MSARGRFFVLGAVVIAALAQVGTAAASHKIKSAEGYLVGAVDGDVAARVDCLEGNGGTLGAPVLCFQMPRGAHSYKLSYEWRECAYHRDVLRPTGQYSGDCISSRKEGRTVRVWAESSTEPWGKEIKIVWSHKKPRKSGGAGWWWF